MPNHCFNALSISGPKKDLDSFEAFAVGKSPWLKDKEPQLLSCARFIPPPDEAVVKFDRVGYGWCCKNWGTKWGCYRITKIKMPRSLHYSFDSAWSPPLPVIKAMGKLFPSLRFHLFYREHGECLQGHFICKGGKIIKNSSSKYYGHMGG